MVQCGAVLWACMCLESCFACLQGCCERMAAAVRGRGLLDQALGSVSRGTCAYVIYMCYICVIYVYT